MSPELYLRRPPAKYEGYRLDRLLKRKAEEGVQIRVVVYKEVTQTMTMSSSHTKHHLEDMHKNIRVFRHPDHAGGEQVRERIGIQFVILPKLKDVFLQTYFWSHHNKVVCVDNEFAAVGGLDICYGRWDTQMHPMADVHPNHLLERTLFPGQDYNNARVQDFQQVNDFMSNQQSPLSVGRMPWHDVHVTFRGPAVLDIAHLFAERWNFVKDLKYPNDKGYTHIAFPHGAPKLDEVNSLDDAVKRHPHTEKFHELGQIFRHPFHEEKRDLEVPDVDMTGCGPMDVQVIRSAADWSNGTLTEHSIMNAYVEMIREANHCIYIENQFFITATEDTTPVINLIGAALVQRILSAAKDKRKFKIIVVIPTIPCFAGELQEAAGIRCIMDYQYKSINRGGKSIMEKCAAEGVDANEYISFYNLRGIDRINTSRVREMEKASGISFHQAQVAAARVYLGEQGYVSGRSKVAIRAAEDTMKQGKEKDSDGKTKAKVIEEVDLPKTVDDAMEILRKFQSAVPAADDHVKDSIAGNVFHGQTAIKDEPWPSSDEEEEKSAFVTEETYVHSKLLIVDDRRVLIGSANLNDRSQKGNGDSETAVVIEDTNRFESVMNGEKYMAAPFAASFRRHLWRQHLGLVEPQECTDETAKSYPTDAMRPAPYANPDPVQLSKESEWERIVEDPLSEELEKMWKGQAKTNTDIADEIFQVVPTDKVGVSNFNCLRFAS